MAAQTHTMDEILSRSFRYDANDQTAVWRRATEIWGDERRPDLSHTPALERDRDHRAIRSETVCVFLDLGRRFLRRAARVHRRSQGNRIPGRDRSAHADWTRLAACVAPQARQEVVEAVPALSYTRRKAALEKEPGCGTRRRNLADVDCRAGGLSHRPVDPRQRLRIWRCERRQAVELQERTEGLRAVPA